MKLRPALALPVVMFLSLPVQASILSSGSVSGYVTADVDHRDTGHGDYDPAPQSAAMGGSIRNEGTLSINNGSNTLGAITYYGMSASTSLYEDASQSVFYSTFNNYVDGWTDGAGTFNGTSHAETVFSFSLDGDYDFDYQASIIDFYNGGYEPSFYAELWNMDTNQQVFYTEVFGMYGDYDGLNAAGTLGAGNYRLNIVAHAYADSVHPRQGYAQVNGSTAFHLTEVSAVPVPAAVWLFGSGLIGLAGMARRKSA